MRVPASTARTGGGTSSPQPNDAVSSPPAEVAPCSPCSRTAPPSWTGPLCCDAPQPASATGSILRSRTSPHMTRHTFAMTTLERLVRGYYQRAAQLVVDTDGDNAMALYLTKADPLLVLRDLMGHASVATTQAYLHLLDTQRIFREAYEETSPTPCEQIEAATDFQDSDAR